MSQQSPYYCGLDLGQSCDPSALAVLERSERTVATGALRAPRREIHYTCPWLQRWTLGTSYTTVANEVAELLSKPPLAGCRLIIDASGCGRPVFDIFRDLAKQRRLLASLHGIIITAGQAERPPEKDLFHHVAKVVLISTVQVVLQQRRLQFAAELKEAPTLVQELQAYRTKITPALNEVFNAREGANDDLLLAVAIGVYFAEKYPTVKSFAPVGMGGNYTQFFGNRTLAAPGGGVEMEEHRGRPLYPWEKQQEQRPEQRG